MEIFKAKLNLRKLYESVFRQELGIFTRIILVVLFSVIIFFANSFVSISVVTLVTFSMSFFFKTPLKSIFKSVLFMNLLYVIGCIPAILFFGMNAKGFFKIFVFFVKTFDLMVCNKIFLSGILPSDVGILLQKYSKNLKFLNVDFFEISTIIMVSLRFFNVIFEETERAINALKCRGISFRTWHLVRNIKVIFLLIGNVIEFAFSGNEEIAMALEARGYGYFNEFGDEVKINFNFLEITVLSLSFFLLGVTLFCNFLTIHMTKI